MAWQVKDLALSLQSLGRDVAQVRSLAQEHLHAMGMATLWLLLCYGNRVEYLLQRLCGPQRLNYFFTCPLKKSFATS